MKQLVSHLHQQFVVCNWVQGSQTCHLRSFSSSSALWSQWCSTAWEQYHRNQINLGYINFQDSLHKTLFKGLPHSVFTTFKTTTKDDFVNSSTLETEHFFYCMTWSVNLCQKYCAIKKKPGWDWLRLDRVETWNKNISWKNWIICQWCHCCVVFWFCGIQFYIVF